jgi:Protein of unknown function (DUF3300)
MKLFRDGTMKRSSWTALALAAILGAAPVFAQPPSYPPQELERMVSRIALYPDSLLAQVLAAATFSDQIPDAARWADQHHYLQGEGLAAAINGDRLPWDPSVQALLPFPSVLDMMASDPRWTGDLGNAFLSQQQDVMEAVQRDRRKARDYGYLRSNPQIVVSNGPYIEIVPVNAGYVVVPVYDPLLVYAPPRPGFFVGGAINFGFGVSIGAAFRPWGWGYNRFGWNNHTVIINNNTWNRTWVNRTTYAHPYAGVVRGPAYRPGAPVPHFEERHELHERSAQEREAPRGGRVMREEEHRHDERRR